MLVKEKDMNTNDLRNIIIQEIKDLNNGESTKEKAAAIARLSQSLVASKRLELQVARFRIESGKTEQTVEL